MSLMSHTPSLGASAMPFTEEDFQQLVTSMDHPDAPPIDVSSMAIPWGPQSSAPTLAALPPQPVQPLSAVFLSLSGTRAAPPVSAFAAHVPPTRAVEPARLQLGFCADAFMSPMPSSAPQPPAAFTPEARRALPGMATPVPRQDRSWASVARPRPAMPPDEIIILSVRQSPAWGWLRAVVINGAISFVILPCENCAEPGNKCGTRFAGIRDGR